MENEEKNENIIPKVKKKETLFSILITEAVFVVIILSAVLIIKYFFPTSYKTVKKWYGDNFLTETKISEVIEESEKNEV